MALLKHSATDPSCYRTAQYGYTRNCWPPCAKAFPAEWVLASSLSSGACQQLHFLEAIRFVQRRAPGVVARIHVRACLQQGAGCIKTGGSV